MQKLRTHWLELLATCVTAVLLAFVYTVASGFVYGSTNLRHASVAQTSDQAVHQVHLAQPWAQ